MGDEKLYPNEIIFYGSTISVAFGMRLLFASLLEPGVGASQILYLLVFWAFLIFATQILCYVVYFNLADLFPKILRNVPKERKLSPRHFAAATSSIVTAFTAERIYHVIGNPVVALIPIFPLFWVGYELARRLGPG